MVQCCDKSSGALTLCLGARWHFKVEHEPNCDGTFTVASGTAHSTTRAPTHFRQCPLKFIPLPSASDCCGGAAQATRLSRRSRQILRV